MRIVAALDDTRTVSGPGYAREASACEPRELVLHVYGPDKGRRFAVPADKWLDCFRGVLEAYPETFFAFASDPSYVHGWRWGRTKGTWLEKSHPDEV